MLAWVLGRVLMTHVFPIGFQGLRSPDQILPEGRAFSDRHGPTTDRSRSRLHKNPATCRPVSFADLGFCPVAICPFSGRMPQSMVAICQKSMRKTVRKSRTCSVHASLSPSVNRPRRRTGSGRSWFHKMRKNESCAEAAFRRLRQNLNPLKLAFAHQKNSHANALVSHPERKAPAAEQGRQINFASSGQF